MSFLRSFFTFGSFTMLSRVVGFVRDATISALLGATYTADAFFVAFRIPNLFRMFVAEGAMSAAFVPLHTEKIEHSSPQEAQKFVSEIFFTMFFLLCVIILFCYPLIPYIIRVIAPGFSSVPEKMQIAIKLTRIMFPYIFCIGLVSILGGALQTKRKFAAMAFMPIIPNITLSLFPSLLQNKYSVPVLLSYSFMGAGVLQLFFMLIVARRQGIKINLTLPKRNNDCRVFFKRLVPTILGNSITRINIVINTFFASMSAGSVSYIYYADRLHQLPTALIGIAMSYVLLPNISQKIVNSKTTESNKIVNNAINFCIILGIPAALAFIVISKEIVITIFGRGKFSYVDVVETAAVLKIMAFNLPAVILSNIMTSVFFANKNTKTPSKISCYCLLLNVVVSLLLTPIWHHKGIAVSICCSAWLNLFMLLYNAKKKQYISISNNIQTVVNKTILCSGIMSFVLIILSAISQNVFTMDSYWLLRFVTLSSMIVMSLMIYLFFIKYTKALDIERLIDELNFAEEESEG